jgi:DnaJ-class molecular chaperone
MIIDHQVEENFIKIQEAYELLSDPVKRKQYDSSLDFDEILVRGLESNN